MHCCPKLLLWCLTMLSFSHYIHIRAAPHQEKLRYVIMLLNITTTTVLPSFDLHCKLIAYVKVENHQQQTNKNKIQIPKLKSTQPNKQIFKQLNIWVQPYTKIQSLSAMWGIMLCILVKRTLTGWCFVSESGISLTNLLGIILLITWLLTKQVNDMTQNTDLNIIWLI